MKPFNDIQAGAFFCLIAAGLVFALTIMAMKATDEAPQPKIANAHVHSRHHHNVQILPSAHEGQTQE